MPQLEIILPAVRAASVIQDPSLPVRIPSFELPEKRVTLDLDLATRALDAARSAAARAYAPYSRFFVGAAAIMADDPNLTVFSAANVENASYGNTLCAERNALHQAAAAGFRSLRLLALSCAQNLEGPLDGRSPCGACRQTIREFTLIDADRDTALILIDSGDDHYLGDVLDISRLLPWSFHPGALA